jgi:hypothetical protein
MGKNTRLIQLLIDIKKYIEESEEMIEGEWGRCRSVKMLIEDNDMPPVYDEVCKMLIEEDGGGDK